MIQIEATSFTISEPVAIYTIEPLIYKYATTSEKKELKEKFNISEFNIEIIKLERIFIDKIFATEFYYERNMYEYVSKHLYDISIMIHENCIKKLLKNNQEIKKIIDWKRKEEKNRIGGISENKQIVDFEYMKLNFNNELVSAFNKMQKIYILDDKSKLSFDTIIETINILQKVFQNLK